MAQPNQAQPRRQQTAGRDVRAQIRRVFAVLTAALVACAVLSFWHIHSVGGTHTFVIDEFMGEEVSLEDFQVEPPDMATVRSVRALEDGTCEVTIEAGPKTTSGFLMFSFPDGGGGGSLQLACRNGVVISEGLNFTGWEALFALLILTFLSAGLTCVWAFWRLYKESLYGYEMASHVGFAIFFLFQGISFVLLALSGSITSFSDLAEAIMGLAGTFVTITLIPMAIAALLVSVSNIALIRYEGRSLTNLLGVLASFAWALACLGWNQIVERMMAETTDFYAMLFFLFAGSLSAITISFGICLLTGVSVTAWLAARHVPTAPRDYLIILGCGLRDDGSPLPLLAGRVDAARTYAKKQVSEGYPAPTFVPSGGQGADEVWSEAEAMSRYIKQQGDTYPICKEDRSTNTRENFAFSAQVIKKDLEAKGEDAQDARIAFATTNYHVLRGYVYAEAAGMRAEGIASNTKAYFWPNAFLREFVGLIAARLVPILVTLVFANIIYAIAIFASIQSGIGAF